MNDYLEKHLPELAEAERAAQRAVIEAAGEVSKAEAAQKRAEQAWSDAKAKANAEACAHFAANNKPSGAVVHADLLARVVEAIDTPELRWNPDAQPFREKAAGSVATVASVLQAGRVRLRVRLYQVDEGHLDGPRWSRVASLDIQAHNGALPSQRKRSVSEDDCAALLALAKGEVGT